VRYTTCGTRTPAGLCQEGRTLEEVKALLGHESIRTSERYGHMRPDHGFDAVSVLERPDVRRRTVT